MSKPYYYEPVDIDKIDHIDIGFRPANDGADFGFVTKSWIQDSKWRQRHSELPLCDYIITLNAYIKDLYIKKVNFMLAYDPSYPSNIFGFMVYEFIVKDILIIHFVYIKKVYRRMGICKLLYNQANPSGIIPVITDSSTVVREILRKHTLIFNPFILQQLVKREPK